MYFFFSLTNYLNYVMFDEAFALPNQLKKVNSKN